MKLTLSKARCSARNPLMAIYGNSKLESNRRCGTRNCTLSRKNCKLNWIIMIECSEWYFPRWACSTCRAFLFSWHKFNQSWHKNLFSFIKLLYFDEVKKLSPVFMDLWALPLIFFPIKVGMPMSIKIILFFYFMLELFFQNIFKIVEYSVLAIYVYLLH